jgi:cytosine/adenosine deaminase-related metal-dependent hydrolase
VNVVSRSRGERGFTTIQYTIAVAWSLVLLVLVANFMVDLYARGAVRDALDDGVRAGVPATASAEACEARAREVVSGLVRGPLIEAHVHCEQSGAFMTAQADVSLRSWLPMLVPNWDMTLHAEALRDS